MNSRRQNFKPLGAQVCRQFCHAGKMAAAPARLALCKSAFFAKRDCYPLICRPDDEVEQGTIFALRRRRQITVR
jgi:hypothetical protein